MRSLRSVPVALVAIPTFLASASAQHAQVSAVAVDPADPRIVWVCNRDNHSVSVVDTSSAPAGVTEIAVGVNPRSVAFSSDGSRVFVANQRGNVPPDEHAALGFSTGAVRGSVSVIDTTSMQVTATMTDVGVEPYGVAVSPNGLYFAVSAFRSGTIELYDAATLAPLVTHQYLSNLSFIPAPFTIADADANRDGIADTGEPRGFVIRSDSQKIYVTHHRSPFVSVLDVALDGSGLPTSISMSAKIDTNEYPFDPFFNPTPVQTVESQGLPRFLEDIALAPNATRALVPHVLHNVNHDVNHDFAGALDGDFANRVYPALTMIDTVVDSFGQPGDGSRRLHNELAADRSPAECAPFGEPGITAAGDRIALGGNGSPILGGQMDFQVSGMLPGDTGEVFFGTSRVNVPTAGGTMLVDPRVSMALNPGGARSLTIPSLPQYRDLEIYAQARVMVLGQPVLSNAVKINLENAGYGTNAMGHRAGQPSRVLYGNGGTHALMLNRGSEDVFMYRVTGSNMELVTVFPPRLGFVERTPLDTSTPLGDLPLGMALVGDASTANDDALLYVMNEATRTLSTLRVDYTSGTIFPELDQIPTVLGADEFTLSERIGEELFEDASRAQTAGHFNNSCGSCHFEGGGDGNVWQRPAGPRSTMPMYGGTLATGLILWKGVRLNSGETGPMFGGENGGHGMFTDDQQQGLTDFHEKLAVPLNPNRDPLTGGLTPMAEMGQDLFFGTNDTGMNPTLRSGNCGECHPKDETNPLTNPGPRGFTADFLDPLLTGGDNIGNVVMGQPIDLDCFSLRQNIVVTNLRDVNTGANIDIDGVGGPDDDRNLDGFSDLETYAIMNADSDDDFQRDDANSYPCPCDPAVDSNCDPVTSTRIFERDMNFFSIPTKLGVFSTGPYFHDHVAFSLRMLVDPEAQSIDPVYGSPAFGTPYPGTLKLFNGEHDVRGHNTTMLPNVSKVQQTLVSTNPDADTEAILAYIQSL